VSNARLPLALVVALSLAGCAAPPDGPGLMTRAEIEAARNTAPPPDTTDLQARASRLAARAAQLRRASIDSHDQELLRQRGQGLAAR